MTTTNETYPWSLITTRILGSAMTTTNETYPWSFITTQNTWFNYDYDKRNISMIIHYQTEYLVQLWLRQTKHIHGHSLPHIIFGSTMTTTNETYPWSFITKQNTWFNYDYDKRNISMIIHYQTEYLVQLWLRQTDHIHDHSLPHIILGSTMTTTNETYPWSFITTHNTWFNYDYDKRNISMIIHYDTITWFNHDYDKGTYPWSFITTHNTWFNYDYDKGTYPWSFITTHNTWFNYDYDKRNISMIIHYDTITWFNHDYDKGTYPWSFITTHNTWFNYDYDKGTYPWSFITTHNTWFNYDYDKETYPWSFITTHNTWFNYDYDKGTYPWPFITTQNTWFNYDYDKWNISMIIHYHTEYLVQLWLRQMKHIHDHSLPHRILGSTMTTTNETYPWSFITTQNTWFNNDYDKWNISMIIHYHTEYLVQLWLRQTKHIHDHALPHRILGSTMTTTMTTTNVTYPWSFITTQNTWFNYDYDKRNISLIIHYHTEYLVQLWHRILRQTEHIHDHSLPHRILGSTMTTTNETYPWFITTHHYLTEYGSILVQLWPRQTTNEHIHDHSLPHRILGSTMTTTNGTYPWSWFNYDYDKQRILGSTMTTTNETYPWSFITTQNTWFNYDYDKRNISMIIHYHTEYLVQLDYDKRNKRISLIIHYYLTTTNGNISLIIHYHTEYLVQLWLRQTKHILDHSLPHIILGSLDDHTKRNISMIIPHRILGSTMTTTNETYPWSFITTQNTWFNYDYDKRNISLIIHYHTDPWLFITTQNTWFNDDYD